MPKQTSIILSLLSEIVLSLSPLVVVFMAMLNHSTLAHFLSSPEWAIIASIFFGQSLVRFIASIAGRRGEPDRSLKSAPIALAVACVLVFGLIPSLWMLAMVVDYSELDKDPPTWLCVGQVVALLVGALTLVVIGTVGRLLGSESE